MEKNEREFYVAELISKLLKGNISPEEDIWLKNWINERPENQAQFEKLTDAGSLENKLSFWNKIDNDKAWNELLRKLPEAELEPQKRFNYLSLLKCAAIAIMVLGISILLYRENKSSTKTDHNKSIVQNSIRPGSNQAMLILGNGQTVALKNHTQISINEDDGTTLSNKNEILAYKHGGKTNAGHGLIYNTIVVPRGGEYQLVLADGSRIWMNSSSSLRYPTSFSGSERRVYLSGEAYFEVAKNARMPFIVKTDKAEVKVLGTHFNVKAYGDEELCKTTLLEGAVRVQSSAMINEIKPGQQAVINSQGQQKITSDINVEEEVAWKNGLFMFTKADIKDVMQQVSRWYDIEVVYEGKVPDLQFSGQLSRKVDFSGFTNILKYAGLNFTIKGKTVIVAK
ncbi:FecR domain-containing protein [Mucilaginibacter gossypii]|uniref:FecR family protein n=1 Tax=Mucilaginibacter gossypii TaxID=551996 RepID=UPI000DCD82C2|nr:MULTISPECIES: FecR family protein [Mucilaginibacter]QTE38629.1 FecR domain-containing protein [Mucilaginibacter gossypii]RAV55297.1 FecR family protein [Mucilaginibacter rubeus]